MSQFDLDPDEYMAGIRAELLRYEELEDAVSRTTEGVAATRILELGVGVGETAERVLRAHPGATLTAIDASAAMVERARSRLPADRVGALLVGRLEDPLPSGSFDLVVSALVVHHLPTPAKRHLFERVAAALEPGARFVLGDVFVPTRAEDAVTPLEPGVDVPDRLDDQLAWLAAAGFEATVEWSWKDLAVVRADRV
jgi:tRNA (cmo5U34)-methyltransferase